MLTVNKLIPQGRGLAPVIIKRGSSVELDWDVRCKSRFDATDSAGRALAVFLPRGTVVRGGDVLVVEDGSFVAVKAAAQALMEVRYCSEHGSAHDLLRAAYHLGNRHVQLELKPDHLKLEPDHVLADMLRQRHLLVAEVMAPFEPEAGAYESPGHAAHAHQAHPAGHDHAGHDHGAKPAKHDHGHGHHEGDQDHAHGNHGHDHGHDDGHKHNHPHDDKP